MIYDFVLKFTDGIGINPSQTAGESIEQLLNIINLPIPMAATSHNTPAHNPLNTHKHHQRVVFVMLYISQIW